AYENSLIYKERTKKLHDNMIKNRIFNVGDQVLIFNSRLKIFSDGCNFKVNCHRLKHYHGRDPPPLEIPDHYPPMVEVILCWICVRFPRPSCRPIGWDSFAMWDCEQDHMRWSGEVDGTVQVSTGVRECSVEKGVFWREIWLKGYCLGCWGFGVGQKRSFRFIKIAN
nr:reverse transcriptase domain-containing protein [Tanacetum cinerariifolium]